VLGDDLEAVLCGNGDGLNQSAMGSVSNLALLRVRLTCQQRNSNQRHFQFLLIQPFFGFGWRKNDAESAGISLC
jgi:hypothetical protein